MNYRIVNQETPNEGKTPYLYFGSADNLIQTMEQALELIVICWEKGIQDILIHADALSEAFFNLRSGLAGDILQKFVNYQMRTAIIMPAELAIKGKTSQMLAELNRGQVFRAFKTYEEAEQWLMT